MNNSIIPGGANIVRQEAGAVNKRKLAGQLQKQLKRKIFAAPVGKEMSREEYLSKMLVDLAINWEAQTIDGGVIKISDMREWTEIVKFIHTHLDGAKNQEQQFNGLNVFKVYAGIDVDKI